ncbi:restriction endonuclease subunit S [Micromonospora sp. NPDC049203]|uniref:restriction endonuclease subunit S n=1 Tax=Micromonospora sp. NPDC049203 TaxID=3364267 RepID=UPI00371F7082
MTDLPVGWTAARLGDLVAINPRKFDQQPGDDDLISLVPMAAVEAETGRMDVSQVVAYGEAKKRSLTPFQDGDVLFAKVTPCMENGKVAVAQHLESGRALGSTELFALRSEGGIDPHFLAYYLLWPSFRKTAQNSMTGAVGLRRVPRRYLENYLLPVPPLLEQRRIVAVLEGHLLRLACAEQALTQAMARQTQFVRSVHTFAVQGSGFGDALSGELFAEQLRRRRREVWLQANPSGDYRDPVLPDLSLSPPCPPGWSILSLEAVTDPVRVIRYGILKPRVRSLGVVPYVEVKDLAGGSLSGKSLHLTSRELDEAFSGARIKPGDIVMAVRGSYERSAIVPAEIPSANISRDVARIAPLDGVDAGYLHNYLQSAFSQNYFKRHARGVAVKGVNISTLRQLPVVVPPPERQAALVEDAAGQLLAIERLAVSLRVAKKRSRALRDSLMAQAFAGRLVPQDPDDEPATELLGRIRAERATAAPKQKARAARTRKELAAPPTRVTGDNYQQEALPL